MDFIKESGNMKFIHSSILRFTVIVVFLSVSHSPICTAQLESVDKEFYDSIFQDYRPELRPMFDFNDTLYADVKISLDTIIGLDSKQQSLEVLAQVILCWREPRITWDLKDGPTAFVVPIGSLWTPDIVVRNSLSSSPIDVSGSARPYVYSFGYACLKFFSKITTSCNIDVRKFPFDTQECEIQLSMPRSLYDRVRFGNREVFDTDKTQSGDWVLHSIRPVLIQEPDPINKDAEEILAVKVKVSRHYSTHLVNTLIPLMGLFFLNPFVFMTPTGHGERISFSMSLLLSYAVTISTLSDVLPGSTEHVCYLSVMASVCFFVSGFIAMLVIVISRVEERQGVCDKAWGWMVIRLFSDRRNILRKENRIDAIKGKTVVKERGGEKEMPNTDGLDDPFDLQSFGVNWLEVATCLNRVAFWFTMILSAVIVAIFLTLIFM